MTSALRNVNFVVRKITANFESMWTMRVAPGCAIWTGKSHPSRMEEDFLVADGRTAATSNRLDARAQGGAGDNRLMTSGSCHPREGSPSRPEPLMEERLRFFGASE